MTHIDRHGGDESAYPELQRWLQADPKHRGAFLRASAAWSMLNSAHGMAPGRYESGPPPRARLMSRRAVAAGLSACALAGGVLWGRLGSEARASTLSSGLGEVRRFDLDDGSTLVLDTSTRVDVLMTGDRREARLIAGAAWFDIVAQPDHPFVVSSDDLRVHAADTAFSFNLAPRPQIIVTRGTLNLFRASGGKRNSYALGRGARATLQEDDITRIDNLSDEAIARALAWRERGISLDGESVADAVQQFNRYNERKLVVEDAAVGTQPVVGWFAINQPQAFAEVVALSFGGEVIQGEEGTIRIVPAKKSRRGGG